MRKGNPIHLVLKELLTPIGFLQKGDSWYHRNRDVVQVVNLQKSQYGNQYYLNYGIWLLALGESTFPREEKCHVRFRIEDITIDEDQGQYEKLLNLESDIGNEERTKLLRYALNSDLLPFIKRSDAIAAVKKLFIEGALKRGLVHINAKRLLDNAS